MISTFEVILVNTALFFPATAVFALTCPAIAPTEGPARSFALSFGSLPSPSTLIEPSIERLQTPASLPAATILPKSPVKLESFVIENPVILWPSPL